MDALERPRRPNRDPRRPPADGDGRRPGGARQGRSGGPPGYDPPCPATGGTEEYRFQVYGLDAPLELAGGTANDDALDAISAATVASQRFVRTYERPADDESG
ncbi:hypothetical protein ACFQL1_05655 [Halomicroarcula sp. GCM10025709]|uniref:hypothetical protein n=1 Tax=Halomicroarcula sp. GCM10025709 TaxID=3252669 RepID=UPI003611E248